MSFRVPARNPVYATNLFIRWCFLDSGSRPGMTLPTDFLRFRMISFSYFLYRTHIRLGARRRKNKLCRTRRHETATVLPGIIICNVRNQSAIRRLPTGVKPTFHASSAASRARFSSSMRWKFFWRSTKLLVRYFSRTTLFSASSSGEPWKRMRPSNRR